jgi:hypothetical protein
MCVRLLAGFSWLQMGSNGDLLWMRQWTFGFVKTFVIQLCRYKLLKKGLVPLISLKLVFCRWHPWKLFSGTNIQVTLFLYQHSLQIYRTANHDWQVSSLSTIDLLSIFNIYYATSGRADKCIIGRVSFTHDVSFLYSYMKCAANLSAWRGDGRRLDNAFLSQIRYGISAAFSESASYTQTFLET